MAEIKWNDEQKAAIDARNKSIAVSAAAGSGKTAVLVERIIRKICDSKNPVKVENLLVVTFTKAAANEMRERLYKALEKRIAETPNDRWLLRQRSLLPMADIKNMDQFFNALVKDNFHQLGITPDYRILDESERILLENESLSECADIFYDEDSPQFRELLEILDGAKSDTLVTEIIRKLSKYADSFMNPDAWLEGIKQSYNSSLPVKESVFGKAIIDYSLKRLDYAEEIVNCAINLVEGDDELVKEFDALNSDLGVIDSVRQTVLSSDWDSIIQYLSNIKYVRYPNSKKGAEDTQLHNMVKVFRDKAKKLVTDLSYSYVASQQEYSDDKQRLYPVISKLVEAVFSFRKIYAQKKLDENAYDFSDILHLAIKLLVDADGKPTDMALELREKYDEILIDEYQDTNEAQDAVFCTLSKQEKNLFLVGDIKQSIYGFRLAMPQVFINKINAWKNPELKTADYICLGSNYRSRAEVLECINYFFERTMTSEVGEIDYDSEQALKYGAEYPEKKVVPIEFTLLEKKSMPEDYNEITCIADKIEKILETQTVYDKDLKMQRKAEPKDICVLFRSNGPCKDLLTELEKRDVPAYYEVSSGFFDSKEVQTVISLLKIIDNPLQDVPLVTVLMSPIFGFTPDDVALLRIADRKNKLYYALEKSTDEKCVNFMREYSQYKRLSTVLSVQELIRTIYDTTGYLSVVSSLSNGETRRLNLMLLLSYAAGYEENSSQGLSGFMRYIERCEESKTDFSPAVSVPEGAQVVRIMTIHKSKGLEFPIVVLSGLGSEKLSVSDESLKISSKTGVGLMVCDSRNFKKYKTVQYQAAYTDALFSNYSEELRVLYVAMTRAKEKLYVTASINAKTTIKNKLDSMLVSSYLDRLNPIEIISTSSFMDLLLKVYIKHKDADSLRKLMTYSIPVDSKAPFECVFEAVTEAPERSEAVQTKTEEYKPDEEILKQINERTHFSYKYEPLSVCTAKKAASSFNNLDNDESFFATAVPEFSQTGGLNAAEKGTAVHRFMEVCDFSLARSDFDAELDRLVSAGKLSEQQAQVIDRKMIADFFESPLYKRIAASPKVYREQKFTMFVPLKLAQPELQGELGEEKILVQGVIDCAFEENGSIAVLDYKTDRVKSTDELEKRYTNQLHIYKLAAQQLFNTDVSQLLLYSFKLSEEKEIKI